MSIKLLLGGSPCTHWSIAQKTENRETTNSGLGWELFLNYVIAKEKFQPDFFLYENNKSIDKKIKAEIEKALGVPCQHINSALVSAQNRERFYCHNFGIVQEPQERGLVVANIVEDNLQRVTWKKIVNVYDKPHRVIGDVGYTGQGGGVYDINNKSITLTKNNHGNYAAPVRIGDIGSKGQAQRVHDAAGKSVSLTANGGGQGGKTGLYGALMSSKRTDSSFYSHIGYCRKLTVTECCRLQTLPDDYCRAVSATQGYKGLGNGWTAGVIIHLLSHGLRDVPLDTHIDVLSLYDGIGTGRYCLDKMGFKNVTYRAYEIDKYAIQIAMSNYPDIMQMGDVFHIRENDWRC